MNKNYGYNFNLRRLSISESGEEYEEGEPDINPETDPEKEFQEREFNPDEDYEWEDEYNPDEDYDWEDEYNPDEDYDWGDEYNPDEDYDWGDEFNPDKEYDWGDDNFEPVKDPPDNENDYESNLSREGTETILSPSEHPEEQLERVIDSESQNISEQNIERKPEEIDEFELVTPEGKAEKPAEPPEIIELMEGGSYNSDYTSEQEPELSSEIEPKTELEDHPEQEFLNESEDKPKEELEKELELINPETGEPVPRQPEWEYIPLQDYLEQLLEQQENRDEVQEIEPKEELEKIPDQESELISEHNLENISDKKSEKSFDQKSELIQEPESEKILKHNQGEAYKTDHLKEKDSITDPKELKKSKHHEYQHLIKTKYEPIFSQIELRKSQKKSKRSDKITEISQKTKKKSRAEESKEINLKNDSTLAEKKEKRHKVEVDYSSEQIQHISKNRAEKYEELETSEILELPKQEKLKEKQKREFSSSELLELQERYRQETGKRPIYNKEQTKGFKEWLESQKEYTLIKTDSNRKSENREEWELFLKQWINEANETEVSKEKKEELLNIIRKYHQNREIYRRLLQLSEKKELTRKKIEEIKILIKKLEETTSIQKKIFKNLRAFRAFYNENIRWYKHKIIAEKHKFLKHLSQKLNYLKEAKNPRKDIKQNWKELLNENLYKNITLNFHDKSLIDKILQKEEFTEDDKKELISILSKLPTEELITLLGNEFKKHTQHYVKWGWDYDPGVKRVMLNKYLASKLFCIDKSRRKNQICKSDEYVIDKNMTEIRILPEIVSIQQAKESIVASIRYTRQDKKDIRDVDINENIKYNPNFVLVGLPHFNPEQEIDVVFNQPIKDFVNNLKRQYYTISYDIKLAFYKSGNLIEIDQNSEEDITHWLIRNGYSKDEVIYIRPVDKDYHGPIYEKSCWIEGSPSPYTTHFDNLRIKLKDLAYRLVLINEYTFAATSRFLFPKEKSGTYIYLVNTYAQMSRGEQFNIQETSLLKMHARFLNNLENLSKTKQITDKEYTKYNNEINDLFNEQYSLYGYNNPNPFYTLGRINAHRIGDLLMEYGFIEENSITGINGIYEFINAFGGSRSSLTMDNYKKKKYGIPGEKIYLSLVQSLKSAILHFTSENIEITEEIYKKLSNSIEHIINDFIQHIKDTNSVRDNFKSYTGKYAKIDLLISIQDSHPVLRRIKSLEKLSKLLFNDEGYLLSYFIKNEELAKRPSPHLLHKITFNVKKWSVKDFDILVSDSELRDLKYKVSNIIYKWMFSNPSEYTRAYVVENPRRFGKLQSKSFLQLEYELMQSLTHAVSVHNNKDITDFREVINELRLSITVEKLLTRGKTSASVRNLMRAKTIIISYILDGTLTDQKLKFYDFALNKIDEYLANRHLRLYEKNLISKKGYDKHLWSDDKITAYHVITLLCRDLGFDPLFFEPLDPQIFNADPTSELFNRHHIDVRRKFSVFLLDLILTDTSKHREYDRFIPIKDQKTLIKIIQELIRNDGTGPNKEITSKDIIKTFLSNFNDSKVATFYLENYWQSRDFQEKLRQFNERKRMIKNRNFESFLQIKYSDAYNRFFDDSMQLLNSLNILSDYREFKLSKIFSISDIEYLKRTFNI